jgi:diacylglycerol kinase family enzyme
MGSANGMAEEFELDASPKALLEQFIVSEDYFEVDLLLINTTYYLLHLGDVGANASLVSNYDQDETRGFLTYAKHFWNVFNNLKSFDYEIETPENTYERKGVMLAICNGRKFGTGIPINTIGKMNDGKFELVLIKAVDFKDLIKATLSKFDDDYEIDNFEILQTTSAQIRFKEPKLLQIDGEIMGEFDHLQVEVLPKSLKFIKR